MPNFFDTLLANAPGIIQGFAAGGVTGGLQAGAEAFLLDENQKRQLDAQRRQAKVQALSVANSPAISVANIGTQPVAFGGQTFRSTFQPNASRPVGSGIGNVPLPPIPISLVSGGPIGRASGVGAFGSLQQFNRTLNRAVGGAVGVAAGQVLSDPFGGAGIAPPRFSVPTLPTVGGPAVAPQGLLTLNGTAAARGSNFAKDACGKTIKFFCSPRPQEGWVPVQEAAARGLRAKKPFARFDMSIQQFVRMPRRRMNPCNIRALGRAERRRGDFLDLVIPMIRDKRKEQAGKKPSVRRKKRKK